ncbi:MAG: hypothetical protein A3H27_15545 [Acidobacteria bacterium RIFCSPLOWO2_02_FULL_59_13]|nr:MAG: hypothetical protein A3H27_15545 [Acidobacteria bacterium RIFCSPLOWO2_02_FULL_59_13]
METIARLEPVAVKRTTAARMLDCGQTTIWRLCKEGKLDTIKIGADERITVESIRRIGKPQAA